MFSTPLEILKKALEQRTFSTFDIIRTRKKSYNVNFIVYYIYANYSIYLQLTCITYLNYFYWYHFGSS